MSALVVAFLLGLVGRELVGPRKRKDHEPRMLNGCGCKACNGYRDED